MKIGKIEIENPLILAPMEDVTDLAFRRICKQLGADIVYTEFTSSEALIRDVDKAFKKIEISDEERPVAIQVFGSNAESMASAAEKLEQFKPDFIDINCGCWVKKLVARGEGAGLLRDLKNFEKVVKATVNATKLPVTVKTRLGWDSNSIVILEVAKMVEQAGAQALTVHCRTRCQGYKGNADWSWLSKIKKEISIPLIGNGDVQAVEDVEKMLDIGCDGVMIGRGAISNPWIFKQAKHYLRTKEHLPEVNLKEKIELCVAHLNITVQNKGVNKSVIPFRKFYVGYLKGIKNVSKLRSDIMKITEHNEIIDRLYLFLKENE